MSAYVGARECLHYTVERRKLSVHSINTPGGLQMQSGAKEEQELPMRTHLIPIAAVCLLAWPLAGVQAELPQAAGQAQLKAVTGRDVLSEYMPLSGRADQGAFSSWAASTSLKLLSRSVKVAAAVRSGREFLAVDADGNGKFSRDELHLVSKGQPVEVKLSLPPIEGEELINQATIRIYQLEIHTINQKVPGFSGRVGPASCLEARIDGTRVRLFDADLDGRISQMQTDAVQIGQSPAALPLGKVHRIGSKWLALEVKPAGKTVGWKQASAGDGKVAEVQLPDAAKFVTMVLADEDGLVVDVASDGSLPAGKYRLVYGVAVKGDQTVRFHRGLSRPVTLKAGAKQALPFGRPMMVFNATADADGYEVGPRMYVVGQAGETYDLDVSRAAGGIAPPELTLTRAGKTIESVTLGYG